MPNSGKTCLFHHAMSDGNGSRCSGSPSHALASRGHHAHPHATATFRTAPATKKTMIVMNQRFTADFRAVA